MATATPYLFFKGNAAEAMDFYKSVLGAELQTMPKADGPGLMHADLWLGDLRVMGSDSPPEYPTTPFGNAEVCINSKNEEEMRAWFDGLSAGGAVEQPLIEVPWGGYFGKFKDKFGVAWMFSIDPAKTAE